MVNARIYLEGGGGKDLNTRCREGFRKLLEKCGFSGRMPKLTACGSRNAAFDDFNTEHSYTSNNDCVFLLVDSEDPVPDIDKPWEHLSIRDGWIRPSGADDEQALLMTTCMETWIAADRNALKSHFGQHLKDSALPALNDLEGRARNSDGNPDYPQAVVFLTSIIDVTVGS